MRHGGTPERPAVFFDDAAEFRAWLEEHHDSASELWIGRFKKHVPDPGLTYDDSVREALCYGWIDSQVQRIDADAVRQRWTPRKPGSTWSNINIAAVEQLTAEGRMHPAGLAAFARRRDDRSGIYSYENEHRTWPEHYEAMLRANSTASAFWDGATPSYRKGAVAWVVSAKQEATRDKRLAQLIDDCANLRLIPSQRFGKEPSWAARLRDQLG